MDETAKYNKTRWEELAQANIKYSRPFLGLDPQSAREKVDPTGVIGDISGKDVLCLAGGGGQQSVALALLGANVTVFDLSETQLQRDRKAAAHYRVRIKTVQGDMRDLSCLGRASFDIVWHAYSINYVPNACSVFREVARVLRIGGLYRMECGNPFVAGLSEKDWNGEGYPLKRLYVDGAELAFEDLHWHVEGDNGVSRQIGRPKEFRHTLSTVLNGLVEQGFVILSTREVTSNDPSAGQGTWEHFKAIVPPGLVFWAAYRPDVFAEMNS